MKKRKYSLLETSIAITAGTFLTAILLLPLPIVQAATELRLNETVIPMIETVDSSVKADKMVYSVEEEAGVYDNTPEAETVEMMAVDDEGVVKEYLITENETAKSNMVEIDQFKTEWQYNITAEEIRLVALIAELEDRDAMAEVAEVILNRILSDRFGGDTAAEIIFAPKQFYSVSRITDDMIPCDEAVQAVTAVFRDGVSTVGDSLFFAERSIPCGKIAKGLYLAATVGETNFYGQE